MKTILFAAAASAALYASALAQGGAPYNASGQQAGGPRAGMERRLGVSVSTPTGSLLPTLRRSDVRSRCRPDGKGQYAGGYRGELARRGCA